MSQEIVVFEVAVDCGTLQGRELTEELVADFLSPDDWMTTSRNGWFLSLLGDLIQIYEGFNELRYLTERFALVLTGELSTKRHALQRLLTTIRNDTEPFVEATPWYGATAEEVRSHMDEAKVMRQLDDDCVYAFSNFFSFLAWQVAVLEEAEKEGKCLLHVAWGW